MANLSLPSCTITFLFTDIEGSTRLLQRLGDGRLRLGSNPGARRYQVGCLAGFAGLAAMTGDPAKALRLFSAAQLLVDDSQIPLSPADLAEWQRDDAAASRQLDKSARLQAQEEGRSLTLEQAIEFALKK